jgi:hypothetical protein
VVELGNSESHRREREHYPEDINREKKDGDGDDNRKGRAENINNQPVRVKSSKNQGKPFEDRTKNTQGKICQSGQHELIHELIKKEGNG